MIKDKMVWLVCLLLFLTGLIFGAAVTPRDFFKVESVHEFLECIAALFTVFGVSAALFQWNSWKKEQESNNDHNLAVKAAGIVNDYTFYAEKVFVMASVVRQAVSQKDLRGKPEKMRDFAGFSERAAIEFKSQAAGLKSVSFECEMFWGRGYVLPVQQLINFGDRCAEYLDASKTFLENKPQSILLAVDEKRLENIWGEIEMLGVVNPGDGIEYVRSRVASFIAALRRDFITSKKGTTI